MELIQSINFQLLATISAVMYAFAMLPLIEKRFKMDGTPTLTGQVLVVLPIIQTVISVMPISNDSWLATAGVAFGEYVVFNAINVLAISAIWSVLRIRNETARGVQ